MGDGRGCGRRVGGGDMSDKSNWIVRMRCVVVKDVYCVDCTKVQAQHETWDHAESEEEVNQVDWQVVRIDEDKP